VDVKRGKKEKKKKERGRHKVNVNVTGPDRGKSQITNSWRGKRGEISYPGTCPERRERKTFPY